MIAGRTHAALGALALGRAEVLEALALRSEINCARSGSNAWRAAWPVVHEMHTRCTYGLVARHETDLAGCFVARRVRSGSAAPGTYTVFSKAPPVFLFHFS
jgi:hypothetical protein